MSLEKLRKLEDNQIVTYRVGMYGRDAVVWGGWHTGAMYVRKQKGKVITITPKGEICCDFSEKDYFDGGFSGEDYLLEIKEIED